MREQIERIPDEPRVAILGDSVIAGLGVRGRSYAKRAAQGWGASHILVLARSTHTVLNAVGHLERLRDYRPDVVIVSVGGSDCLVHAGSGMQKLLDRYAPKSWKGVDGLEPRPWFTGTRYERYRQRGGMLAKLVLKHVGIRITGGFRRVPPAQFVPAFEQLMAGLAELDCLVVVVGLHPIDERLFPRTNASIAEYDAAIRQVVAQRHPGFVLVDPTPYVQQWDDFVADHAHFNDEGHTKVLAAVEDALALRGIARPGVGLRAESLAAESA